MSNYDAVTLLLTANVTQTVMGNIESLALVSASLDASAVTVQFNQDGAFRPIYLGMSIAGLAGVYRMDIRSTVGQTVVMAFGECDITDNRSAPTSTGLGAIGDAAATSDAGAFSLIALTKRLLSKTVDNSATWWRYAPPVAGITNSVVAVTIKAAAAAGIRNYISALQIMADPLGAATEVAIRDGAGGAVLWRVAIPLAGLPQSFGIVFPVPLRGTAATLLEVVTLTASITGAVYVNSQGYTGA